MEADVLADSFDHHALEIVVEDAPRHTESLERQGVAAQEHLEGLVEGEAREHERSEATLALPGYSLPLLLPA